MTTAAADEVTRILGMFGHEYEVDGRLEWHSSNCLYRKLWAMGDQEDEPACIAVRAFLRNEPIPKPGYHDGSHPASCMVCHPVTVP